MSRVVSVVGAGHLGSLLVKELLTLGDLRVRVLVRSPDKVALEGVERVRLDVSSATEAEVAAAIHGSYAIVSTLQGGPDVIVDGQLKILRAAAASGVHRFIPSTFSFNFVAVPRGLNAASDMRAEFAERAEAVKGNVEVVHILNGAFLDRSVFSFVNLFDPKTLEFSYFGDGSSILEMTTWADTARFAAAAAVDHRRLPRLLAVQGDAVPIDELGQRYAEAKGLQGMSKRLGSISELEARLQEQLKLQPTNLYAWLPLQYQVAVMRGFGRLPRVSNFLFPHIRPLTFDEAVKTGVF